MLIMIGSGILLWQANYSKPHLEEKLAYQQGKIDELTSTISSLKNDKTQISNDKSQINSNESKVIAPEEGQVAGASTNSSQPASKPVSQSAQKVSGKVNINTATVAQLDTLPGIGVTYAQRIIDYRNSNGGFKSVDELKNVKGIGDKTFEKFKDQITF